MEDAKLILDKLELLKKEIESIKEHLIDITLTRDDINSLNEAEEDLEKGKTKRL